MPPPSPSPGAPTSPPRGETWAPASTTGRPRRLAREASTSRAPARCHTMVSRLPAWTVGLPEPPAPRGPRATKWSSGTNVVATRSPRAALRASTSRLSPAVRPGVGRQTGGLSGRGVTGSRRRLGWMGRMLDSRRRSIARRSPGCQVRLQLLGSEEAPSLAERRHPGVQLLHLLRVPRFFEQRSSGLGALTRSDALSGELLCLREEKADVAPLRRAHLER